MIKNKVLGSTFIIAGTAVGAGMLAMPLTSAGMGVGFSILLLTILWVFVTYSALLIVEVYQASGVDDGIATITEEYYGKYARAFISFVLFFLMFAILSAYVTGGGSLITKFLSNNLGIEIQNNISMILFTTLLGIFVVIGTSSVDMVNRICFLGKVALFVVVIFLFIPFVRIENIMSEPVNYALIISAAPIFFTAFGFHVVLPSVVKYLDNNTRQLKIAVWSGTTIPFAIYVLWQLVIQGSLDQATFIALINKDPNLSALVSATETISDNKSLVQAILAFSSTAVLTAFLGVSLSLFDGLKDLFDRIKLKSNRPILGIFTFAPPLAIALFYPDGFIMALSYAGIAFTIYGAFLPIFLAHKARKVHPNLPYRAFGGNFGLLIALLLSILIISVPQLVKYGYLPYVIS